MIYKKDDLTLNQISPSEFERLSYELLLKYGFTELTWRQGGADHGRDIEGSLYFNNQLHQHDTKWFFECKRYTAGVNVDDLTSKVAWADAEKPDYLVFFVASYLTTAAKDWLIKIQKNKFYKIIIIEGEELKTRLIEFPDLIERFFSTGLYQKLFSDIKNHWFAYSVDPSYEILKELSSNLNPEDLTINELGFLFISLYKQYDYFETRNDYYGDFNTEIFAPLYARLKELASVEKMALLVAFEDDFSHLSGSGIMDKFGWLEDGDEIPEINEIYQYYALHLNPGAGKEHWAIGHYLFFRLQTGDAFEVFSLQNSDFKTAIQYHPALDMYELDKLTLETPASTQEAIKKYLKYIQ
jgi:hypothetical protein